MELIRPDIHIPFDRYFKPVMAVSALLVLLSVTLIGYRMFIAKNFRWGTEFAGGTEVHVKFQEALHEDQVREALKSVGHGGAEVLRFGGDQVNEFIIRLNETSKEGESLSSTITRSLTEKFGRDQVTILRVDEVGPKVGRELKKSALISFFLANLGIWLYIWFRFTPSYSPGCIVAQIHDVLIALGVFVFFGFEFDLTTVAAILTLIGYSVNDTIVIYDRIRDNLKSARRGNFVDVVVGAVNQTLSRTILTSFLTFLVVASLCIYSQGSIRGFAFFMMVGIISGSYSTLFISVPILVWLEGRQRAKLA